MKTLRLTSFLLLIAALWSCGKSENQETTKVAVDSAALVLNEFFVTSHQALLSKLELAAIGSKTNNADIRKFCDQILKEDKQLLDSISQMAAQHSISLADTLSSASLDLLKQLDGLDGLSQEKGVIRALSTEHRKLYGQFRKNRRSGADDITSFVTRNIASLKSQREIWRDLRKALREEGDEESEKRKEQPA